MPKIILAKAAQVPLKGPIRWPGYTAEVDDATFDALSARGVLAVEVPTTVLVEQPAADPTPEPAEDAPPAAEDAPPAAEDAPPAGEVQRPKQAANLETWQAFARGLGIDTKGMTKQEIIAATK